MPFIVNKYKLPLRRKRIVLAEAPKWIPLIVLFLNSCTGFRPFDHEEAIQIFINRDEQVVIGKEHHRDSLDCSAHAYLNKTAGGLLFTVEVRDDSVRTGNTASYLNDGIELYFDFRPPRLRENNFYEKGVFQAVILPDPGKKQIAPIEWFPKGLDLDIPGTRAYTELRENGYVVQVSIPWSSLKRNHFWPRNSFFLDVAINDADTGRRESQLMWAGKSDNWNNPKNFRRVSFEDVEPTGSPEKPNFLVILTSQQNLNAISAYGCRYLQTPYMDALAKHGIRFQKAYSASPSTTSSRFSLITGLLPNQSRLNAVQSGNMKSFHNLGDMLAKEGYQSHWAGSWYLPEKFPHIDTLRLKGFRMLDFMEVDKANLSGRYTDEYLAESVSRFLKSRIRQPFFLVVSFQNPQDINLLASKPDAFPVPANLNSAPPLPANHNMAQHEPDFLKDMRLNQQAGSVVASTNDFTEEEWRNYLYHYYRLNENLDQQIGKIISTLETESLDENTLIILTSDHGEGAGSHAWAGAGAFYEESVKTPFIVTQFGKVPNNMANNENLVSGTDLLPTVLDYAGIDIPENLNGQSLRPLIENQDTLWRNYLVSQLDLFYGENNKKARMITDGSFKLIVYSYGKPGMQLFNLQNDPGETKNLAYINRWQGKKNELLSKLQNWIKENGDEFEIN